MTQDTPERARLTLRSDGIAWQEIDGDVVILDLERSVYLTTNKSGGLLARMLVEGAAVDDLIDALCREFGIEHERAAADVEAFLDLLAEKKLLA